MCRPHLRRFGVGCGAMTGEKLVHRTRTIQQAVSPVFRVDAVIDAFQYVPGLDLTGYEDGTENPVGEKAVEAGVVQQAGEGLDGSSFAAVQQWVHDFENFNSMSTEEQDNTIGRRRTTTKS